MKLSRTELLVLIVIIAVLVAALLPAVQQAREAARRAQSKNQLKQLGLALHNYHDAHNTLPAGGMFDSEGRGYHGWMVSLVPYLDASPLYSRLDFNQPWDSPRNAGHLMFRHTWLQSPGENTPVGHWEFNLAHYSANAHLMAANRWMALKDIDSREQTFIAAELAGDFVPWACPYSWRPLITLNGTPPTYGRYSKDGGLFLFVDGHVEFITNAGFPAVRDSLRGPDLAGFGETPANIVRPKSFPVPKDALQPDGLRLSGDFRLAEGMKDYRGRYVHLRTNRQRSKRGAVAAHDSDFMIVSSQLDLEQLQLSGDFTDAVLPQLQKLTQLRELQLDSDGITEASLAFVEQLPKLKVFVVDGKQISDEVRQRLKERLPKCDVRQSLVPRSMRK